MGELLCTFTLIGSFDRLFQVDRELLSAKQQRGQTMTPFHCNAKERVARRNVTIHEKGNN